MKTRAKEKIKEQIPMFFENKLNGEDRLDELEYACRKYIISNVQYRMYDYFVKIQKRLRNIPHADVDSVQKTYPTKNMYYSGCHILAQRKYKKDDLIKSITYQIVFRGDAFLRLVASLNRWGEEVRSYFSLSITGGWNAILRSETLAEFFSDTVDDALKNLIQQIRERL